MASYSFAHSLLQALPRSLESFSIGGPLFSPRSVLSSVQSSKPTGIDTSSFNPMATAQLLFEKLQDDPSAPWENDRGNDAWIRPDWSFLDGFPAIPDAPLASHAARSKQAMNAAKAYQGYTEFFASNPGMVLPFSGVVTNMGEGGTEGGIAVGGARKDSGGLFAGDSSLSPTPLSEPGWTLVAHMKDSGGMFAGDSNLSPTYSFGTFKDNPSASDADFYRPFAPDSDEILLSLATASSLPAASTPRCSDVSQAAWNSLDLTSI